MTVTETPCQKCRKAVAELRLARNTDDQQHKALVARLGRELDDKRARVEELERRVEDLARGEESECKRANRLAAELARAQDELQVARAHLGPVLKDNAKLRGRVEDLSDELAQTHAHAAVLRVRLANATAFAPLAPGPVRLGELLRPTAPDAGATSLAWMEQRLRDSGVEITDDSDLDPSNDGDLDGDAEPDTETEH